MGLQVVYTVILTLTSIVLSKKYVLWLKYYMKHADVSETKQYYQAFS